CGDLFFINELYKKYPFLNPVAVDTAFDDELKQKLLSKYNGLPITLWNEIQEFKPHDNQTVSLILLMDVIEHIEKDTEFLSLVSSMNYIGKDTLFLITVPAFNRLFCSHDKWLGHYRRYSLKMLLKTIEKAGLQPVQSGYFFTSLLFPRLIQKGVESFSKKETEKVKGVGTWNKGKLLSSLFEKFLLCDFYFFRLFSFLGIKVPGLSTYVLCKQP
ncbi:MAG: hypothetical protein RR034_08035, partial [Bacteroidales bacterium]